MSLTLHLNPFSCLKWLLSKKVAKTKKQKQNMSANHLFCFKFHQQSFESFVRNGDGNARRRRLVSSRVNEKHTVTVHPLDSGWGRLVPAPHSLMTLWISGGLTRLIFETGLQGRGAEKNYISTCREEICLRGLMRIWVWSARIVTEPCGEWREEVDLAGLKG